MIIQYMAPGFEPLPLEHESSPITTSSGLSPFLDNSEKDRLR